MAQAKIHAQTRRKLNIFWHKEFFPNRSFTSKGSSGDQRDGTQKTPNPVAGQLRRTPGGRGGTFDFRKNFKIRENGHF